MILHNIVNIFMPPIHLKMANIVIFKLCVCLNNKIKQKEKFQEVRDLVPFGLSPHIRNNQ